jgi:hypothetical protein
MSNTYNSENTTFYPRYNTGLSFALLLFLLMLLSNYTMLFAYCTIACTLAQHPASLAGSLARLPCSAALAGSLARQSCSAALLGSLALQPCPSCRKITSIILQALSPQLTRHSILILCFEDRILKCFAD